MDTVLQGGFSGLFTGVVLVNKGNFNRVACDGLHQLSQLIHLSEVLFITEAVSPANVHRMF